MSTHITQQQLIELRQEWRDALEMLKNISRNLHKQNVEQARKIEELEEAREIDEAVASGYIGVKETAEFLEKMRRQHHE